MKNESFITIRNVELYIVDGSAIFFFFFHIFLIDSMIIAYYYTKICI